jgi:hypothetical protein
VAKGDPETIRRLRQGDLTRLCLDRYGYELPDDDAGRESLHDLVCLASLAPARVDLKMRDQVEMQAPWMDTGETCDLLSVVSRTPFDERWRISKELGERHNVTNAERERMSLWQIKPNDITKDSLAEHKKANERERKRRQREAKGSKTRAEYLASVASPKPWLEMGISRATYYRRKRDTGSDRDKGN